MIIFTDIFLIFYLFLNICESKNNNNNYNDGPPIIVEQPQDILAELDKPMALHCRAEAASLDDLRVNWYKDGKLVTMDPNARIITEFMALHVINTMPQDAGAYYCVAENSHGRTQSRIAKIQFLKLDKDFIVSPTSTTASLGERIRLRCEPPSGSPIPIVYWTKNGKNLSLPLDNYDLVLPSIQSIDFGSYRCIASNGLVRQSSIAYITEFHRPKISIYPSVSRIDIERGRSVDFQCQTENTNNEDQYQIEWHYNTRNGKLVGRNNRVDISSVQYNHSGLYVCLVIHNNGRKRHIFSEEIQLAVHERLIENDEEKLFSQITLNVHAGRSAILDCQLPLKSNEKILWSILNRTDISFENSHRFEFIDKDQYRLKIRRIIEFDNDFVFECYYENQKQSSQSLIKLQVERFESPPIIIYVPNNQTVPIGVDVTFPCQTKDNTDVQWWFMLNGRLHKSMKIENNKKYKIDTNHDLIIHHTDKNDVGTYKCIVTNKNDDETSWMAHLNVEDSRSNVIFHRVERTDLPQAPTQPLAVAINSNSIELAWNYPSTDIQGYLIEYFHLNSDDKILQWKRLFTINKNSHQLINDLKISSTYQFLVRARNSYGYGQPSLLSELIETRNEQQSTDDFIYLLDPVNIQETSVAIQWNILKDNHVIDRYSISITNEKDVSERIETIINKNNLTTYTITNLRSNTDYSIRMIALNSLSNTIGRPSNTIIIRTLESNPSSSPLNVNVELTSLTSLSIRWNPPLESEQNGRIIAYKVNCLGANESTSIRLLNISSDAKGLHVKNLIENLQYCISVAARTRIGYGPYSQPICVIMNAEYLKLNNNLNQYNIKRRLREAISQPWFFPLMVISSILFICILLYACWLCFHRLLTQNRHGIKFGTSNSSASSSSSNQFVEMPIQKTLSNGTRYDLIKDTPPPSSSTALWTDTIASGIRLPCCATTTASASSQGEHDSHIMNIHKNPINSLLQQSKQQTQQQQQQQQLNPYATTGIFQHNHSPPQTCSSLLPIYSDSIRSPPQSLQSHHYLFDQQQAPSVQYQPPWLDHPSSSFQYRSQSHTPYNHQQHYCMHCTSQSHPHTPSSIRTTARPIHNISQQHSSSMFNNEIRWPIESTMNSSPIVKRQSQYAPSLVPQSSNPMMMNSLGGETMTTSWASSTDASNRESISSSITDKNEQRKHIHEHSRSSSEGSLFSDSDNQQDELNASKLNDNERRPTFLMPTM